VSTGERAAAVETGNLSENCSLRAISFAEKCSDDYTTASYFHRSVAVGAIFVVGDAEPIASHKSCPQCSDRLLGRVIAQTAQDAARSTACDIFSISRNYNGSPARHDGLRVAAFATFSINSESLRLSQSLKILRRERVEEWRETSRPNMIHHAIDRGRLTAATSLLRAYSGVHLHPGEFPASAIGMEDVQFGFVHLDADLYASTLASLEFFYPRMAPGGIILTHDYSTLPGVAQAFADFLVAKPSTVIELPTTQAMIVVRS